MIRSFRAVLFSFQFSSMSALLADSSVTSTSSDVRQWAMGQGRAGVGVGARVGWDGVGWGGVG